MEIQVKSFSDIERAVSEIRYWIINGDMDKMYSDRGKVLEQTRALFKPAYIHLWMILYPIEGQEYTVSKNISDLATWLLDVVKAANNKVTLGSIYVELEGQWQRRIKSNLENHHGYPDLNGLSCIEISNVMDTIWSKLTILVSESKKKNKRYLPNRDEIIEIIKESIN